MLESIIRNRPKHLIAVYVEPRQVEVLRARRQWRTWEIESTENVPLPEGESVYDFLQRLNLRPKAPKATALVLILPRTFYTFHREHYPASLQENLEDALTFDWQENLFFEHEKTLYFAGSPVPINGHVSVPIFALHRAVYDKFHQVLGAGSFQTFGVIPSALTYGSLLTELVSAEQSSSLEMVGRMIDPSQLEIHRFYKGQLLDSIVVGKGLDNLKLFRESLRCLDADQCQESVHIHLVCSDGECTENDIDEWRESSLPFYVHSVGDSLLSLWSKGLFEQEEVRTFESPLHLMPWKAPRIVWPVLAALVLFAAFAGYQVHSVSQLKETTRNLKKQTAQLETQWKPIEQLQTRISKFQEDQKTLTQFNSEGYPLVEILTMLTQTTSDDTWLNYLSLRSGQLMLRGESKSAIKYLSDLSKIDGLTDVRFASPVTRNPSSDQERFNVQIQVEIDKLKKTLESVVAADPAEAEESLDNPSIATPVSQPSSEAIESSKSPKRIKGIRRGN